MTDMVIPPEAVEAAARGMFAEEQCDKRQRQDLEGNWNSRLNDEDHAEYRALATAALEAALPHLRALPWEGIKSREPEGEALEQMRKWYADNDLPGPPE